MMEELEYEGHRGLCGAFFRRFGLLCIVRVRSCCSERLPRLRLCLPVWRRLRV